MKYTGSKILQHTYDAIKRLNLPIKELYKAGNRVVNPNVECMTVGLLTGTANQIQEGIININVFVPDVLSADGRMYCNSTRCAEIEEMLNDIDDKLSADGEFTYELDSIIQTIKNPTANEHYVNVSLRYRVLN